MGTLLTAVALFTPAATTAALFYLIHSTFAAAALFLVNDQIMERRGSAADRLTAAPSFANAGLLAGLFFLAAIGMAGMPPLTGFLGKLMVMDSARGSESMATIWTVILVTSLVSIVGFARAGSVVFWKSTTIAAPAAPRHALPVLPLAAAAAMVGGMVALTVFAGPVTGYLEATAAALYDPSDYITAVLGPERMAAR
jgi:multicomponent K+:H+ antiporter subunit D